MCTWHVTALPTRLLSLLVELMSTLRVWAVAGFLPSECPFWLAKPPLRQRQPAGPACFPELAASSSCCHGVRASGGWGGADSVEAMQREFPVHSQGAMG